MKPTLLRSLIGALVMLTLGINVAAKSPTRKEQPMLTTEVERCIAPAADFHGVNVYVLRAILKVESGLNPNAIGYNRNGSVDLGLAQINSMHLPTLAKQGIYPEHLKDACISSHVAAWHLKKSMSSHGNTWEAVARYHSATPYYNQRYQILLMNELIRSGVLQGDVRAVPPLY
jgi:hypothetical protein